MTRQDEVPSKVQISTSEPATELVVTAMKDPSDIRACFEVMKLLRPSCRTPDEFVEQVLRLQAAEEYVLLAARLDGGTICGVVGFRLIENLMHGRHVYVDDLVTAQEHRSQGIGAELLKCVVAQASRSHCTKILLDTGADNKNAARFYLKTGFSITALRFTMVLD